MFFYVSPYPTYLPQFRLLIQIWFTISFKKIKNKKYYFYYFQDIGFESNVGRPGPPGPKGDPGVDGATGLKGTSNSITIMITLITYMVESL